MNVVEVSKNQRMEFSPEFRKQQGELARIDRRKNLIIKFILATAECVRKPGIKQIKY